MSEPNNDYSSNISQNTRVKMKSRKKTVGITLPPNLIERVRNRKLNISRITEQALISILDYLEPQNNKQSSDFLDKPSFPKEGLMVPRTGLEPATTRSSASPSTMFIVESSALPV